jgi:hypothetical protein
LGIGISVSFLSATSARKLLSLIDMLQVTLTVNAEIHVGIGVKCTLLLSDLTKTGMCPQILMDLYDIKFHKNPFNRYLLVFCVFTEG